MLTISIFLWIQCLSRAWNQLRSYLKRCRRMSATSFYLSITKLVVVMFASLFGSSCMGSPPLGQPRPAEVEGTPGNIPRVPGQRLIDQIPSRPYKDTVHAGIEVITFLLLTSSTARNSKYACACARLELILVLQRIASSMYIT